MADDPLALADRLLRTQCKSDDLQRVLDGIAHFPVVEGRQQDGTPVIHPADPSDRFL